MAQKIKIALVAATAAFAMFAGSAVPSESVESNPQVASGTMADWYIY